MGKRIRAITDEQVAHYRDHGWVKLPRLISPDLAAEMLQHAKMLMGPEGDAHASRSSVDITTSLWQDFHGVIEADPCFGSVGLSAEMGANAQRLMRRDVGVVLQTNLLAVKIGAQQRSAAQVSAATDFHQDGPSLPFDRAGRVTFWIALDHIEPEMGLMRFLDRSHHLGSLGNLVYEGDLQGSLLELYPELGELPVTEPTAFEPGDASAHTMYTVHDAPANSTDKPRWTFIINYIPSDTIFNGAQTGSQATLKKIAQSGVAVGQTFSGDMYPRVFG